tara:strand:+ start:96 stop:530 length:435 start_codon:yes stop_codon:yes gene_type:complete
MIKLNTLKFVQKSILIITIVLINSLEAKSKDGTMWVFEKISQYEIESNKLLIETEVNSCVLLYSEKNLIKIKMGKTSNTIDNNFTNVKALEDDDFKITLANGDYLIITNKFEESINIFWYKEDIIIRLHKPTNDISKIDCFKAY